MSNELPPQQHTTDDGFRERLLNLLSDAAKVPEEAISQMYREAPHERLAEYDEWLAKYRAGELVDPLPFHRVKSSEVRFTCPICQQPMVATGSNIADCGPCSARLYLHRSRSDRRPSFRMVLDVCSGADRPDPKNLSSYVPQAGGDPNSWEYYGPEDVDEAIEHFTLYYWKSQEVHWDADSTSFGIHTFESYEGQPFERYEELGNVPEIMSPERARNRLRTLIVFG